MKVLTAVLLTLGVLSGPASAIAKESPKPEPALITTYEEDVTGDGQKEVIELKGVLFSEDTNYYRDIWADISSPHDGEWKISYGGGYEPEIQFVDVTHDDVNDLLYQSATGGSGGLYNYQLHTLRRGNLSKIPLPEQPHVRGEFQENFQVKLHIFPNHPPIPLNVEDRKEDYIRLGIYNEEGRLLEKTQVMVDPIAFFEPVLISESKGYGLKSYRQISGAYHADQLGTIETLWYYEDDEWIILQTDWVPSAPPAD